jgi:GNAT-family acetyltransferase (TIGR03103 family)
MTFAEREGAMTRNAIVECGWGRLIFANTFPDLDALAATLRDERPGRRDIAFYCADPHVILAKAPQDLFLDPSHTYRLWFARYRPAEGPPRGFTVRRVTRQTDVAEVNRICTGRGMVPFREDFLWEERSSPVVTVLLAVDDGTEAVIGVVTGIDHKRGFGDPENGSSLWALAVDAQTQHPGVGEALVRHLAEHFQARGLEYMDLSVMHDNASAIGLYEKLGFERVPVFTIKNKNSINEKLFIGPIPDGALNPYARIIVDEARRRGIQVQVVDEQAGYFTLTHGGRSLTCRESLSELTTAIAMSRCDNKAVTRRLLASDGLSVPDQIEITGDDDAPALAFLERHGAVVAKPARGEQGQGISVDLRDADSLRAAIAKARAFCPEVLVEQFCAGQDLRIIVIDGKVVAAAIRRPARVIGTGRHTLRALIDAQSRRRAASTGGESRIPLDAETERCARAAGFSLDDTPPEGAEVVVRKTANLHTGGTIHDVTDQLHPALVRAAVRAAHVLDIPVVGLDFLVPDIGGPDHVIIEANERPGLANHEPQPTAERFVDLLFPQTRFQRHTEAP